MPAWVWGYLQIAWDFLRDEDNRAVVIMLAGGASAVVVAARAIYKHPGGCCGIAV